MLQTGDRVCQALNVFIFQVKQTKLFVRQLTWTCIIYELCKRDRRVSPQGWHDGGAGGVHLFTLVSLHWGQVVDNGEDRTNM